jgi:hypothetical protein
VAFFVLDTYYLAGHSFNQDCCNAYSLSDNRYKPISIVSISVTSLLMAIFSVCLRYLGSIQLSKRLDQNVISLSKDRTIAVVHSMTPQHKSR